MKEMSRVDLEVRVLFNLGALARVAAAFTGLRNNIFPIDLSDPRLSLLCNFNYLLIKEPVDINTFPP